MQRRVAIIGNAGSGKTFLAQKLAAARDAPVIDLDALFWKPPGQYKTKRPVEEVLAVLEEKRRGDAWIVEGVYGELVLPFLERTQLLLWLDLPWEVCRARIEKRHIDRCGEDQRQELSSWLAELIEYAGAYWARDNLRSRAGHQRMLDTFAGSKVRLSSEDEVTGFIAQELLPRESAA